MREYQGPDYLPAVNNRKLDKVHKTMVFRHWDTGNARLCCQRRLTSKPLGYPCTAPRAGPRRLHRERESGLVSWGHQRWELERLRRLEFVRQYRRGWRLQSENFGGLQKGPLEPLAECWSAHVWKGTIRLGKHHQRAGDQ